MRLTAPPHPPTCHKWLHIIVGFTVGCMVMGASPLTAQDDCKALEKVVVDAFSKVHDTPTHVYTTSKIGSQTFTSEIIYAAGSMYTKVNGKWILADSIKDDVEQLEQKNRHNANSKDTCRYLKDEPVNGEMAAVYNSHSDTPKIKIDMQKWISKSKGLLLRQDTNSDGKALISSRYEYGEVKPPLSGVLPPKSSTLKRRLNHREGQTSLALDGLVRVSGINDCGVFLLLSTRVAFKRPR